MVRSSRNVVHSLSIGALWRNGASAALHVSHEVEDVEVVNGSEGDNADARTVMNSYCG